MHIQYWLGPIGEELTGFNREGIIGLYSWLQWMHAFLVLGNPPNDPGNSFSRLSKCPQKFISQIFISLTLARLMLALSVFDLLYISCSMVLFGLPGLLPWWVHVPTKTSSLYYYLVPCTSTASGILCERYAVYPENLLWKLFNTPKFQACCHLCS